MTSKVTGFYFDEKCMWHTAGEHALTMPVGGWLQPLAAGGHAESPESKRRLKNLMDVSGLSAALNVKSAEPASREDLLRVHPASYIDAFKETSDAGGGEVGLYAPFGRGSFEIACLSSGLAIQAVRDVVTGVHKNAYTLSRPPGHHCLAEQGMGFCLLANIPIAIEAAKASLGLGKVAVVDWDVHHGNGTQSIFYDRDDVLTISLHQNIVFPPGEGRTDQRGEGAGFGKNINIPLLPGGGDIAYRDAFELIVMPALEAYKPDLIVVACGLDPNGFDPLARMQAHSETFRWMTGQVVAAADRLCDGKLVAVHEGGYSEAVVPFCGHAVIEELSGHRTEVEDPFFPVLAGQQAPKEFDELQNRLLKEMATEALPLLT